MPSPYSRSTHNFLLSPISAQPPPEVPTPHAKPNLLRSQHGLASLLAAIAVGADFETAGALIGFSQADIEKEMDESPNLELRVNQAKAEFAVKLLAVNFPMTFDRPRPRVR